MSNRDELLELLGDISLPQEDLDNLKADLAAVRRGVKRVDKMVKATLGEGQSVDEGTEDSNKVSRLVSGQETLRNTIRNIIKDLEREKGVAPLDDIVARAAEAGIERDKVEANTAYFLYGGQLIEPVRHSRSYRIS